MQLTRSALRTELQATGFGNSTAEIVRQNNWLDAAYLWVWNAVTAPGVSVKWSFKQVDQGALAVTAGLQPTTPADLGAVGEIVDQFGTPLAELDARTFDDRYAADMANGVTGPPEAFKVVNRTLTFGPTPDTTATFKISYRRRVSHFNSGGILTAGTFTDDLDYPLWPDHHMILVYHAALAGHSMASNPFGLAFQGLRDDALRQMRADLEQEAAPGQVWGERPRKPWIW